jgi:hypothetical protein
MKQLLTVVSLFTLLILAATPLMAQSVSMEIPQVQVGTWSATASNLSGGTGERQMTVSVSFTKPFKVKPDVVVGITLIDAASGVGTRVSATADGISRDGFTVVVKTWGDSKIFGAQGSWVAVAPVTVSAKVKQ